MELTRRMALATFTIPFIPGLTPEEQQRRKHLHARMDSWIRCFHPVEYREDQWPFFRKKEGTVAFHLGADGDSILAVEHGVRLPVFEGGKRIDRQFIIIPPTKTSVIGLKSAAGELLAAAAREPGEPLGQTHLVEGPDGRMLRVGAPEDVGLLIFYPDASWGLALLDSAAVAFA